MSALGLLLLALNCPEPVLGTEGDVDRDVQMPRSTASLPPTYPATIDKARKISASLLVAGTIDVLGKVGDTKTLNCKVMEGSALLGGEQKTKLCDAFAQAAEDAFRQWRYVPAQRAHKPVCLYATVKFDFRPD
jgi:hypothetical protein